MRFGVGSATRLTPGRWAPEADLKTLYKRCLVLALSLSIVALAGLRNLLERELARELNKLKPVPLPPADTESRLPDILTMPTAMPATTVTFSGTVIRDGSRFALLETAGTLYTLDSTGRAWPFEGEDVRVTGTLDPSARLLHVNDIRAMAS